MQKNEKLLRIVQQLQNHLLFGSQKFCLTTDSIAVYPVEKKIFEKPELFPTQIKSAPVVSSSPNQNQKENTPISIQDISPADHLPQNISPPLQEISLLEEREKVSLCIRRH
jgi:hypothetical protein